MSANRSGVYQIQNTCNSKVYIGSAVNIAARWRSHRHELRNQKHGNSKLQNAWNKYGESSFNFSVIEFCDKEALIDKEQFHMDNLSPFYNINKRAANRLGMFHTQETKDKISKSLMGKKAWNKGIPYNKGFGKGYKHTEESKGKMRQSSLGQKAWNKGMTGIYSEDTRKRMGAKNIGKTPWNKGVPITEDAKRKMSETKSGVFILINLDSHESIEFLGAKAVEDFLGINRQRVYGHIRRGSPLKDGWTVKKKEDQCGN